MPQHFRQVAQKSEHNDANQNTVQTQADGFKPEIHQRGKNSVKDQKDRTKKQKKEIG